LGAPQIWSGQDGDVKILNLPELKLRYLSAQPIASRYTNRTIYEWSEKLNMQVGNAILIEYDKIN
jgi:hypothetical protein